MEAQNHIVPNRPIKAQKLIVPVCLIERHVIKQPGDRGRYVRLYKEEAGVD
ncbi:MAG: hypothetical protein RRZ24_09940 [Clostridia bacterium]